MQYADDIQVAVSGGTGDIGSLVQLMEHNLALLSRLSGKNGIKIGKMGTKDSVHHFWLAISDSMRRCLGSIFRGIFG